MKAVLDDDAALVAGDESEAARAAGFDLRALPAGFLDDPYPWYHRLRRHDPVHRCPDGSYFLTRYDDLAAIYRDAGRFSSDKKIEFRPKFGDGPLYRHHTTSLVFNDPPLHTRVRKLLTPAFTPRALKALQPQLVALIDRLLDDAEAKGEIDLIDDFAAAVPIEVIGDLLRVPRDERAPLRGWSLAILGALEPVLPPEKLERGNRAVEEFSAYLDGLIARRRRNPSDDPGDVLSALIRGEAAGDRLGHEELVQNCIFLLNAGHETTTNLIGNGVAALLDNPAELARLKAEPSLIRGAVEEFLRYESSNQLGNRRLVVDAEVGGVAMPAGTLVTLGIGAANRDPAQFADPDRLDIAREPNRHLAFGAGPHICAGNSLARMEGQIAIGGLVRRFRSIERAGPFTRGGRARFRGFAHYPIRVAR